MGVGQGGGFFASIRVVKSWREAWWATVVGAAALGAIIVHAVAAAL